MKLSEWVTRFDSMDTDGGNLYPVLTDDQIIIHDKVFQEYNSGVRYAMLNAKSGSGKTTTIRAIVKTAQDNNITIRVTATTGKASSALDGQTIHSFLGLKMMQNDNANSASDALRLDLDKASAEDKPSILIIDEASMIGSIMMSAIVAQKFSYVLFVLDSSQLPPVKEKAVEWDRYIKSYHYLTKTLRAQDTRMIKLFDDFKSYKEGSIKDLKLEDYVNGQNIVQIDYADCDFIPKNSDSCVVAYRNKNVEFMADEITSVGHNKYNLNSSVGITRMVADGDKVNSSGYPIRKFVNEIVFYNDEDVKIDILANETAAVQKNGYCMYKNFKISMSKNGSGLSIVDTKASPSADTFWIKFPTDEVSSHCKLACIEDKYFILLWDSSEDEYKEMLDVLFAQLAPLLPINRQVKKYLANKDYDRALISRDIINMIDDSNSREYFLSVFNASPFKAQWNAGWSDFMSAKGVVTARYTTSRTIHKSQGISIPCVILTNNSFYGASLSAQYVAATRGKHGIILIDNVPNMAKSFDNTELNDHLY